MQKIKNKFPIHLNIQKKGKLRKIIRERQSLPDQDNSTLILTPNNFIQNNHHHIQQKRNFFLRKYERKNNSQTIQQNPQYILSMDRGAFRAIHTSSPSECIKGFPLRSVTPVKPFRRGIRAESLHNKKLELSSLQQERPVTRLPRSRLDVSGITPARDKFQGMISCQTPEIAYRPMDLENHDQFYMYKQVKLQKKESSSHDGPDSARVVSGTKIEPFRKYQIRQIHKGLSSRQTHYPRVNSPV